MLPVAVGEPPSRRPAWAHGRREKFRAKEEGDAAPKKEDKGGKKGGKKK